MPQQETWLTQEAHDRLAAELAELEGEGRINIQQRILTAREQGDLRENAEYHQAKEDQGFMEGRIRELHHILENATVGERPDNGDGVEPGVKVTLRDEDGDEDQYAYASTHNGVTELPVVSPDSPLGQALRGKSVGDSVTYEAPGGEFSVEVVEIVPL